MHPKEKTISITSLFLNSNSSCTIRSRSTMHKLLSICAAVAAAPAWMDISLSPEVRADKLVAAMDNEAKMNLMHGCDESGQTYTGYVPPDEKYGIPAIKMEDGPQGYRDQRTEGTSTAWPSGLTIGASFSPEVAYLWGQAMAEEFKAKGANVQLGPGMCLARIPHNGRNFEYISGEDPFLGYTMVGPVIEAIQAGGVIANAKHWVNNNQETNRRTVLEIVDERTQWEMYYPPFQAAIDSNVGSVMCSYNKIRRDGEERGLERWSCENEETLQGDLKDRMGFKGWVMSDWGATHSLSINAGLDQEMPGQDFMNNENITRALEQGTVTQQKLDDSARRVLTPLFAVGAFDERNATGSPDANVTTQAHATLAAQLSAASTVLLKNDRDILPLPHASNKYTVAVIGAEAMGLTVHGGGSGSVVAAHVSKPLSAIRRKLGVKEGEECRDDGKVCANYSDGQDLAAAASAAAAADVAIVFVATSSSEASDRNNLNLGDQDALIERVASAAGAKTVVVAVTPGALLTPWAKDVAALIVPFMPGQGYGDAIASVLFGDVNPSARLPITFPVTENDMKITEAQWPGVDGRAEYTEKLLVGYRYYDMHKIDPAFPFGHGLSYTSFEYTNLVIVPGDDSDSTPAATVSVDVENLGKVAGSDVVQLYIRFPPFGDCPPQQLKGIKKVHLDAHEKATAVFSLTDRDLSVWSTDDHKFSKLHGSRYNIMVGKSSRDVDALTGSLLVGPKGRE